MTPTLLLGPLPLLIKCRAPLHDPHTFVRSSSHWQCTYSFRDLAPLRSFLIQHTSQTTIAPTGSPCANYVHTPSALAKTLLNSNPAHCYLSQLPQRRVKIGVPERSMFKNRSRMEGLCTRNSKDKFQFMNITIMGWTEPNLYSTH